MAPLTKICNDIASCVSRDWPPSLFRRSLAMQASVMFLAALVLSGCGGSSSTPESDPPSGPRLPKPLQSAKEKQDQQIDAAQAGTPAEPTLPPPGSIQTSNQPVVNPVANVPSTPITSSPSVPTTRPGENLPGAQTLSPTKDENEEQEATLPKRPEDFSEWKPDDFDDARKEHDPRLNEALDYLLTETPDDVERVDLLVRLLAVDRTEKSNQSNTNSAGARNYRNNNHVPHTNIPAYQNPSHGGRGQRFPQVQPATGPDHLPSDLAAKVIHGLGKSNTSKALDVLKRLVAGKQEAPMQKRDIVVEVVNALAIKNDRPREKMLFTMLTKPDAVKPVGFEQAASFSDSEISPHHHTAGPRGGAPLGRGPHTPIDPENDDPIDGDWIRMQVLSKAGPAISDDMRTALAKYLNGPDVVLETAQLFEQYLSTDDIRNYRAQIFLLENPDTELEIRQRLESMWIQRSSEGMREVLGVPESTGFASDTRGRPSVYTITPYELPSPTGNTRRPTNRVRPGPNPFAAPSGRRKSSRPSRSDRDKKEPVEPARAEESVEEPDPIDPAEQRDAQLRLLWTRQAVKMLHGTLQSDKFDDIQSRLPLLLATVPLPSARHTVAELLLKAESDPQRWLKMGMFTTTTIDPVMLLLAKQNYHQVNKPRSGRVPTNDEQEEDPEDSPAKKWSEVLGPYVADLCKRLSNSDHTTSQQEMKRGRLTLRVHDRSKIVSRVDLQWPQNFSSRSVKHAVSPLELHYLKLQDTTLANGLVFHYRHHNKKAREETLPNGIWLDGFDARQKKSIDIRITSSNQDGLNLVTPAKRNSKGGNNQKRTKQEIQSIVIEILTINIPLPEENPDTTS